MQKVRKSSEYSLGDLEFPFFYGKYLVVNMSSTHSHTVVSLPIGIHTCERQREKIKMMVMRKHELIHYLIVNDILMLDVVLLSLFVYG